MPPPTKSSWYTREQTSRRTAIWHTGNIAPAFSSSTSVPGDTTITDNVPGLHSSQRFVLRDGVLPYPTSNAPARSSRDAVADLSVAISIVSFAAFRTLRTTRTRASSRWERAIRHRTAG
jgi:hypothetical protein